MRSTHANLNRRGLLKAGAALTSGPLWSQSAQNSSNARAGAKGTGRIDVQFHFAPKFYTDKVKEPGSFITTDRWGEAAALDYMGANKVAAGVMYGTAFSRPVPETKAVARRGPSATEMARFRRVASFT